jgi:hypothetical protein
LPIDYFKLVWRHLDITQHGTHRDYGYTRLGQSLSRSSSTISKSSVGKQHAEHLRSALLRIYELTTEWTATVYSGMILKWDYDKRTCDISMPGYISNVLSKFQHDAPKHPRHTPSRYVTPFYGAKTQYATKYETPPLTAKQCLTIQKVTGSILYYARAVDPTVLIPLNDIAT